MTSKGETILPRPEFAGATPVHSSLPDAYTSMQTGVYNGYIMFPSGWLNFKLYEVGKTEKGGTMFLMLGTGPCGWKLPSRFISQVVVLPL